MRGAVRASGRLLRRWCAFGAYVALPALAGCASGATWVEQSFPVDPMRAFRAAEVALDDWPLAIRDSRERLLQSSWVEERGEPTALLGRYGASSVERRRVRVSVAEEAAGAAARVAVHVDAERHPPAGRRAARWEPVAPPADLAPGILKKIEALLSSAAPSAEETRRREADL